MFNLVSDGILMSSVYTKKVLPQIVSTYLRIKSILHLNLTETCMIVTEAGPKHCFQTKETDGLEDMPISSVKNINKF